MSRRSTGRPVFIALIGTLLGLAHALSNPAAAQVATSIVPDGSLGTMVTSPGPGQFNIDNGTVVGTNQFHSFSSFNIGTGALAAFNGPAGTQNILSRVTGGSGSQIDGTLRSNVLGANVFLLNPYGVLFGPNAVLQVTGSFHATTADYIEVGSARFNGIPSPADAMLTSAAPSAFGFLGSGPGGQIDVLSIPGGNILQVPLGETLSLVGGTVNIGRPGFGLPGFVLVAGNPGTGQPGRINLVSVTSGEASFDGRGFDVSGASQLGDINVRAANFAGGPPVASVVDGSEVFIQGRNLVVDNSLVFPGLFSQLGLPGIPPSGLTPGEVNVQVTGDVTVTGNTPAFGFTPGIRTRAGFTSTLPPPSVGLIVPDITMNVGGTVAVSGQSVIRTERLAQGPGGGDIVINADRLEVRNGAVIAANNFFAGPGGALTVSVRDAVLSGGGRPTGLTTQSNFHPAWPVFTTNPGLTFADGGPLTLRVAENLTVENGGSITADSFGFGRSGSVDVSARNMTLSKGSAPVGSIGARSVFAGAAGNIRVAATESITIRDGFLINALNEGSGDGGSVQLSAGQSIEMSGLISTSGDTTGVFASTVPPPQNQLDAFAVRVGSVAPFPVSNFADLKAGLGLPPTADFFDVLGVLNAIGITAVADLTPGDGGRISVSTPSLTMSGDSRIDSSTASDGNAGQVRADVGDLFLRDGAAIRSQSGLFNLASGQTVVGNGGAGSVTVDATGIISISGTSPTAGQGASTVSTGTVGPGDGGNIFLQAA